MSKIANTYLLQLSSSIKLATKFHRGIDKAYLQQFMVEHSIVSFWTLINATWDSMALFHAKELLNLLTEAFTGILSRHFLYTALLEPMPIERGLSLLPLWPPLEQTITQGRVEGANIKIVWGV